MRTWIPIALAITAGMTLQAQKVVRVGGGTAIPAIFEPLKAHLERERGIRLELVDKGPDAAFLDLEAGNLDVAVAGTSMESWLEIMRSKGHPVKTLAEYQHLKIGEDRLSVLINPDVISDAEMVIRDMPKSTIKALFTGGIKNWKELGGADLPVVVVLGKKTAGANKEFQTKVLDGQPYAVGLEVGTVPEIIEALNKTKGAIGIGPFAVTSHSKIWSPPQAPQVVRPFTLLIRQSLTPEQKQTVGMMVGYILGPGQKHINP